MIKLRFSEHSEKRGFAAIFLGTTHWRTRYTPFYFACIHTASTAINVHLREAWSLLCLESPYSKVRAKKEVPQTGIRQTTIDPTSYDVNTQKGGRSTKRSTNCETIPLVRKHLTRSRSHQESAYGVWQCIYVEQLPPTFPYFALWLVKCHKSPLQYIKCHSRSRGDALNR